MFKLGDYVINAANGVCKIEDKLTMNLTGTSKEYFLLISQYDGNSKAYIPVESAPLRIRPVMEENEAKELLEHLKEANEVPVEIEKQREIAYKSAINSNQARALASLYRTTYLRRQRRLMEGKKTNSVDERYYKQVEGQLCNELAFVLHLPRTDVKEMILASIQ